MAVSIGEAVLTIGLNTGPLNKGMKGIRSTIKKHSKAIGIALIGMGAAAIGAAVASVKAFASMGDEVQKMALRTGFSTEALSELRHAAEISGASLGTIEKGIKKMSKTIVDADDGMATYIRSFDRIGISARELMELSPEEQFMRITEAIAELESPTLRAATAQDIFGRAGTELLPLMAEGKEGLIELREEAHKLGIVFSQDAADSAADFQDSLTRLKGTMNGLQFTIAKELLPAFEDMIPVLEELAITLGPLVVNIINWHREYDKTTKLLFANRRVMHEHQKAVGGLTHEYRASIDALIKTYTEQGKLTAEVQDYIDMLEREYIRVMGKAEEAVDDMTEAVEELTEAQKEQQEQYEKIIDLIEDTIEELEYETSVAGKLRIGVDDIIKSLHLMGMSNEEIADTLENLGEEQDNVLKVLEAFGITAVKVAEQLGIEVEAIEELIDAHEREAEATNKATQARINWLETGGGRQQISGEFPAGWGMPSAPFQPGQVIAPGVVALQQGGIAMRPMLATIAERRPEAIIPLDKLSSIMGQGNQMMTVIMEIDGRRMAKVIMPYAVGETRLRQGVKV